VGTSSSINASVWRTPGVDGGRQLLPVVLSRNRRSAGIRTRDNPGSREAQIRSVATRWRSQMRSLENRPVGTLLGTHTGTLEAHPRAMDPYYRDADVVIFHADLKDITDDVETACAVTSPPYNSDAEYDLHDDSRRGLPESGGERCQTHGVVASSPGCRAWVNTGVSQLHCWLDSRGCGFRRLYHRRLGLRPGHDRHGLGLLAVAVGPPTSATASNRSSAPGRGCGAGWQPPGSSNGGTSWATGRRCAGTSGGFLRGPRVGAKRPAVMPVELAAPGHRVVHTAGGDGARSLGWHHPGAARLLGRRAVGLEGLRSLLRDCGQTVGPGEPRSRLLTSPVSPPPHKGERPKESLDGDTSGDTSGDTGGDIAFAHYGHDEPPSH
jgi:hypothetical protein